MRTSLVRVEYAHETGLPATLSEENVDGGRLEELAAKYTIDGSVGGLEKPGKGDMVYILNLAR